MHRSSDFLRTPYRFLTSVPFLPWANSSTTNSNLPLFSASPILWTFKLAFLYPFSWTHLHKITQNPLKWHLKSTVKLPPWLKLFICCLWNIFRITPHHSLHGSLRFGPVHLSLSGLVTQLFTLAVSTSTTSALFQFSFYFFFPNKISLFLGLYTCVTLASFYPCSPTCLST